LPDHLGQTFQTYTLGIQRTVLLSAVRICIAPNPCNKNPGLLLSLPFPNTYSLSTAGLLPNITETVFQTVSLSGKQRVLSLQISPRVSLTRKFVEITTFPGTLSSTLTEKYFLLFRVFRAWIYAASASFFRTFRRALFKELSLKFFYKPDVP